MAALTAARISAFTHRYIVPYVNSMWYKESPALEMFWRRRKLWEGGTQISVPVIFSAPGKSATFDGGLESVTVSNVLNTYEAYFNWKYSYTYWAWEIQEQVKTARGNFSEMRLVDRKRTEAKNDIANKTITGLFSAGVLGATLGVQGTTEEGTITGLAAMCSNIDPGSSYNYGNLDVATYTDWKGIYVDKSSTGATGYGSDGSYWIPNRPNMSKIIRAASPTMTKRPKYAFCGKGFYGVMMELFDEYVRYEGSARKPSLGFPGFIIEGDIEVYWENSNAVDDDSCYIINPDHAWLYVHPDFEMTAREKQSDSNSIIGDYQFIIWAGNLVCDQRNVQIAITDAAV